MNFLLLKLLFLSFFISVHIFSGDYNSKTVAYSDVYGRIIAMYVENSCLETIQNSYQKPPTIGHLYRPPQVVLPYNIAERATKDGLCKQKAENEYISFLLIIKHLWTNNKLNIRALNEFLLVYELNCFAIRIHNAEVASRKKIFNMPGPYCDMFNFNEFSSAFSQTFRSGTQKDHYFSMIQQACIEGYSEMSLFRKFDDYYTSVISERKIMTRPLSGDYKISCIKDEHISSHIYNKNIFNPTDCHTRLNYREQIYDASIFSLNARKHCLRSLADYRAPMFCASDRFLLVDDIDQKKSIFPILPKKGDSLNETLFIACLLANIYAPYNKYDRYFFKYPLISMQNHLKQVVTIMYDKNILSKIQKDSYITLIEENILDYSLYSVIKERLALIFFNKETYKGFAVSTIIFLIFFAPFKLISYFFDVDSIKNIGIYLAGTAGLLYCVFYWMVEILYPYRSGSGLEIAARASEINGAKICVDEIDKI